MTVINLTHKRPTEPGDYLLLLTGYAHPEYVRIRRYGMNGDRLEVLMSSAMIEMEHVKENAWWSDKLEIEFEEGETE